MLLEEFDQKNFRADISVIAFNQRYCGKTVPLDSSSNGKVMGLLKYLSVDGKTPFSAPYINKRELSGRDIFKANEIILMVNIQLPNVKSVERVPLNVFQGNKSYNWILSR